MTHLDAKNGIFWFLFGHCRVPFLGILEPCQSTIPLSSRLCAFTSRLYRRRNRVASRLCSKKGVKVKEKEKYNCTTELISDKSMLYATFKSLLEWLFSKCNCQDLGVSSSLAQISWKESKKKKSALNGHVLQDHFGGSRCTSWGPLLKTAVSWLGNCSLKQENRSSFLHTVGIGVD